MRHLYLDLVPEERYPRIVTVMGREDIDRVYAEFFLLENPPDLYLDCRSLRVNYFNFLLKFVEEYKGRLQLAAVDPVPPPLISRFTHVTKGFESTPGSLLELKFRDLPESIKPKVFGLFGLSYRQEEEIDD